MGKFLTEMYNNEYCSEEKNKNNSIVENWDTADYDKRVWILDYLGESIYENVESTYKQLNPKLRLKVDNLIVDFKKHLNEANEPIGDEIIDNEYDDEIIDDEIIDDETSNLNQLEDDELEDFEDDELEDFEDDELEEIDVDYSEFEEEDEYAQQEIQAYNKEYQNLNNEEDFEDDELDDFEDDDLDDDALDYDDDLNDELYDDAFDDGINDEYDDEYAFDDGIEEDDFIEDEELGG